MNSFWKNQLAQFIDDGRRDKEVLRSEPTFPMGDDRLRALVASTAEALSVERGADSFPQWTAAVLPLGEPWFVAGMESLKAMALVESPVYFRRRNIFVLGNFLARA